MFTSNNISINVFKNNVTNIVPGLISRTNNMFVTIPVNVTGATRTSHTDQTRLRHDAKTVTETRHTASQSKRQHGVVTQLQTLTSNNNTK